VATLASVVGLGSSLAAAIAIVRATRWIVAR
jgi:hypothetical protein